jgi:uncharacterized protein
LTTPHISLTRAVACVLAYVGLAAAIILVAVSTAVSAADSLNHSRQPHAIRSRIETSARTSRSDGVDVRRHPSSYALPQPTRARPLRVLVIGDSLGLDLQYGMSQALGPDPLCHLVQDAVGDTGLTNIAFYNWPLNLGRAIAIYHPRLLVVMLGGNDWQGMEVNIGPVQPGTPVWLANYNARVGALMSEAIAKGVRVLWVGLPIMGSPTFSHDMATLNAMYAAQARRHPGAWFVPTWKLFSTPSGQYAESLSIGGTIVQVRDPDGVHIDPPAGTALIGHYIVSKIDAIWHIRI